MNIKISKEWCDDLLTHSIDCIEFGSLGGNDKDLLHIVKPNIQMDACLHNRDHFLFYKDVEGNTDHLFATPRCLLNGLITGSSTLVYEILENGRFKGTELNWLHECLIKSFQTQRLMKSLIGVMERDKKQSAQDPAKKEKWVEYYWDLCNDILERCTGRGITISPKLGYQGITLLDIKRMKSSKLSGQLPKAPSIAAFNYIQGMLGKEVDISQLKGIEYLYINSWRESL